MDSKEQPVALVVKPTFGHRPSWQFLASVLAGGKRGARFVRMGVRYRPAKCPLSEQPEIPMMADADSVSRAAAMPIFHPAAAPRGRRGSS